MSFKFIDFPVAPNPSQWPCQPRTQVLTTINEYVFVISSDKT